jgi:hypothetical protein
MLYVVVHNWGHALFSFLLFLISYLGCMRHSSLLIFSCAYITIMKSDYGSAFFKPNSQYILGLNNRSDVLVVYISGDNLIICH